MATAPLSKQALQQGDSISDWRLLIKSGTQHIRVDESLEKQII